MKDVNNKGDSSNSPQHSNLNIYGQPCLTQNIPPQFNGTSPYLQNPILNPSYGFNLSQQNQLPQLRQEPISANCPQYTNPIPADSQPKSNNDSAPANESLMNSSLLQILTGSMPIISAAVPSIEGNTVPQLVSNDSSVISQLNSVAEFLAAKGDFTGAINYYERITTADPNNGCAWSALGHSYILIDNPRKAFTCYQQALRVISDPHDPQLWYGIGMLYDKVTLINI